MSFQMTAQGMMIMMIGWKYGAVIILLCKKLNMFVIFKNTIK